MSTMSENVSAATRSMAGDVFEELVERFRSENPTFRISDDVIRRYHLATSTRGFVILCGLGGALGVGLAVLTEKPIADGMGAYFPGYHVARSTILAGLVITLVLGLVVGLIPAWRARTLPCVRALRTTE